MLKNEEQKNEKSPLERKHEEKLMNPINGMIMLVVDIALYIVSIAAIIFSATQMETIGASSGFYIGIIVIACIYIFLIGIFLFAGLKVVNPNEALVFTLFGQYHGTIAKAGFFFVNPFCTGINPTIVAEEPVMSGKEKGKSTNVKMPSKKVSLKAMTLNNEKQKVNDLLGNPIEIGVIVIWKVVNATKAVLDVDNYKTYVATQCDSAIRHVARLYPYDMSENGEEQSLRGSSQEIAGILRQELQKRVDIAGVEVMEARIAHLAYAPEIAAAMLQRQQASAIVSARQMIVEGAVGMVDMALKNLSEQHIVELDEERKAQMVSNLLVVLCGNKDPQPIVNSGSIY